MNSDFSDIRFPGWEVVRKLGRGSFGGVYEIQRTLPDGRVEKAALKKLSVPRDKGETEELLSQSFSTEIITNHYKDQMSELVREYSIMQELGSCGNVVTCHDIQYTQQEKGLGWDIYIRMELLRPLKQFLTAEYKEDTVLRLGMGMCSALIACQNRYIIHRDIKPENILVSDRGEFKLGDFGIAKVSEKTGSGTLTGTTGYMAPEVANHQHYGAQADIYSLGMVLYWMMNERTLPFLPLPPQIPTALQRQKAAEQRFSGKALPMPKNGSEKLKRIVMKACAYLPKDRYQNAQEMYDDLFACSRGDVPPKPNPWRGRAVMAIALCAVLLSGGYALGKRGAGHGTEERKTDTVTTEPTEPITEPASVRNVFPYCNTLAAGNNHIVGLRNDGTVVAAGQNDDGQCNVDEWKDIIAVAAGDYHTVGLRSDGTVVATGWDLGQCDVGEWKDIIAVAAGGYHTVGLRSDGTVVAVGMEFNGECNVGEWKDIIAVAAGDYHTVGLRSDGTVVAVGRNDDGQCNVNEWKDIVAVAAGYQHTAALRSDGTVVAMGRNDKGQCEVNEWKDIVAIAAEYGRTIGLHSNGTIETTEKYNEFSDWQDIVAIATEGYHAVGLRSDGTVIATGYYVFEVGKDSAWNDLVSDWKNIRLPQ